MRTMRRAGLTLIELMVTVAIFSILMLAALSIFVAMTETQRLNERVSEANSNKVLGAATIHFDLQNAGYRLPVPAYAVRHINNVTAATALNADGAPQTPITTLGGCAPGLGLVPGTDVLEMSWGPDFVGPGVVGTSSGTGATTATVTLAHPAAFDGDDAGVLDAGSIAPPFLQSDIMPPSTAVGSVLVFARGPSGPPGPVDEGAFCMGRVTGFSTTGNFTITMNLVDRDLQPIGAGSFYANCPVPDMRVYRLVSRVRYMVCGAPGDLNPTQMRLFRQRGTAVGWAAPEELQAGVENLQVAGRYLNTGNIVVPTGSGLNCMGTGQRQLCFCDDALAPSCTPSARPLEIEPSMTSLTPTTFPSLLRGVRVQLTTTGDRAALSNTSETSFRRPASLDDPQGAAPDNFVRVVDSFSFSGSNFLVVP